MLVVKFHISLNLITDLAPFLAIIFGSERIMFGSIGCLVAIQSNNKNNS